MAEEKKETFVWIEALKWGLARVFFTAILAYVYDNGYRKHTMFLYM